MQVYDHLEEDTANFTWYTTNCKWLSTRESRDLQVPRCLTYFFTELFYVSVQYVQQSETENWGNLS